MHRQGLITSAATKTTHCQWLIFQLSSKNVVGPHSPLNIRCNETSMLCTPISRAHVHHVDANLVASTACRICFTDTHPIDAMLQMEIRNRNSSRQAEFGQSLSACVMSQLFRNITSRDVCSSTWVFSGIVCKLMQAGMSCVALPLASRIPA